MFSDHTDLESAAVDQSTTSPTLPSRSRDVSADPDKVGDWSTSARSRVLAVDRATWDAV
jgi:hypothetical protein